MISAFGVEHGEISKAGPIGAGLARLGARAAKKEKSIAGVGHDVGSQYAAKGGGPSGLNQLKTQQNMKPRGRLAAKSKNYRQGFTNQASKDYQRGRTQGGMAPLPGFLR